MSRLKCGAVHSRRSGSVRPIILRAQTTSPSPTTKTQNSTKTYTPRHMHGYLMLQRSPASDAQNPAPASPQRDPPVSGLFFGSSNLLIFDVSRRRGRARRLDVLGT